MTCHRHGAKDLPDSALRETYKGFVLNLLSHYPEDLNRGTPRAAVSRYMQIETVETAGAPQTYGPSRDAYDACDPYKPR